MANPAFAIVPSEATKRDGVPSYEPSIWLARTRPAPIRYCAYASVW